MKTMANKITDYIIQALIISSIPVWGYSAVFNYINGFCSGLNMPVDLIEINQVITGYVLTKILPSILFIIIAILLYHHLIKKIHKTYLIITLILILLFSLLGANYLGVYKASSLTSYWVIEGNPKLVVLFTTGQYYICGQYNPKTMNLTDKLVIVSPDSKILKWEQLGRLKLPIEPYNNLR